MAGDPLERRVGELEAELARLRAEREELLELAQLAEQEWNALSRSRRVRLANLLARAAHRWLPRIAWSWAARLVRVAQPWIARRPGLAQQAGDGGALARLTARLASERPLVPREWRLPEGLTVVVPVHDAPGPTGRCLDSLERHLPPGVSVLVVDDASRDPATRALLDRRAARGALRVLRNEHNLGYTRSANLGIAAVAGDVVLLNSDTEIGPCFAQLLAAAAVSGERVASVTAVSNAAGAFSVPHAEELNELPADLPFEDLARRFAQAIEDPPVEVPTGNGFCMYLRREAWEDVGPFDEEAFPRGYGEENDWCLRARARGWRHLLNGRVLVRHERSASFGAEREALARAGRARLDARWPGYAEDVRALRQDPGLERLRARAAQLWSAADGPPRPRVLVLAWDTSGGMPRTTRDLMQGLAASWSSFVLFSDGRTLKLLELEGERYRLRERHTLEVPWTVGRTHAPDLRAFLAACLERYAFELVHVRHLAGHGLDPLEVARAAGLPCLLSLHDFFLVCPTANLLDERDRSCGGHCTPGPGRCRMPTRWAGELPPLKHGWVHEWQDQVRRRVLAHACALVTTTNSARDLFLGVHPDAAAVPFHVIPHGRDLVQRRAARAPEPGSPLRVLVLGELTPAKGGGLVVQLARAAGARIEWHFLGKVNGEYGGLGQEHGEYEREQVVQRIEAIGPSVVGLFSLCAETWSHTLTEAWAAGVPVVATDLGAFAERVRARGAGWLVDPHDPAQVLRTLLEEVADPAQWAPVAARASLEDELDLAAMSARYATLYAALCRGQRSDALTQAGEQG